MGKFAIQIVLTEEILVSSRTRFTLKGFDRHAATPRTAPFWTSTHSALSSFTLSRAHRGIKKTQLLKEMRVQAMNLTHIRLCFGISVRTHGSKDRVNHWATFRATTLVLRRPSRKMCARITGSDGYPFSDLLGVE